MSIKIIATTDVHGHLLDYQFLNGLPSNKGLGKLSTYLTLQRQNHHVVYVDNGDINQGTPLVSYTNSNLKENVMAKALNLLKCDFINLGNHDFNFGSDFLYNYVTSNHAKCLTSNIAYKNTPIGSSQIVEIDQKKIGLIGVVTDYIPNWESEKNLQNITISKVFDTIQTEVKLIRKLVDYVIVFYHGGFEKDIKTGVPTENLTGENVGYAICDLIEGIDVLVTGHQHRNIVDKIKNTHIIQCNDTCNKCMEITIEEGISVQQVDLTTYATDVDFESHFKVILDETEKWLNQPIGSIDEVMLISDIKSSQLTKHPITTFLNQVFLEHYQADIASCCLFDVMPGLNKELKYKDIILNSPFPNTLVLKEISGEQLLTYLTQLATYWIVSENEIEINPKFLIPKREIYNYDLLDGISYTINVSKTKVNYITDLMFNNELVKPQDVFKLVVNNYRATGGGNFSLFPTLKTLADDGKDVSDVLIDYVKSKKHIQVKHTNNIKIQIVE